MYRLLACYLVKARNASEPTIIPNSGLVNQIGGCQLFPFRGREASHLVYIQLLVPTRETSHKTDQRLHIIQTKDCT